MNARTAVFSTLNVQRQGTTFLSPANFSMLMSLPIGLMYGTVVGAIAFLIVHLVKQRRIAD